MKTLLNGFSNFLPVSLFVGLCGCAANTFTVTSDPPQADVFVQAPGLPTSQVPVVAGQAVDPKTDVSTQGQRKAIGRTPFTIPMSEFKAVLGDGVNPGQYFPLTVERPGFLPETLLVPGTRFGTYVTAINVKLRPEPVNLPKDEPKGKRDEKTARAIIDHLFLAQKFAITQQFERAHIELDKIINEFPTFPRALSMRASVYYAQKNWAESLKWYEEALKADPQMDDAVRMAAKIRAIQSGRMPANDAPTPDARNGAKGRGP
jgi:tetratricopeptide (TPR) repeat protein